MLIVYIAMSVHSRNTVFFVVITILQTIQPRPRKIVSKILVSHVEMFSHLCIFAHWPIVTSLVECSRIYHVLSNLLSMLRNGFMALSSKLYFFEDAHVPMPDKSGYI